MDGKTLSGVWSWSQVVKCRNDRVEHWVKELVWVERDSLKSLRENDSLYNHSENDCATQGHILPSCLSFLKYFWVLLVYQDFCIRVQSFKESLTLSNAWRTNDENCSYKNVINEYIWLGNATTCSRVRCNEEVIWWWFYCKVGLCNEKHVQLFNVSLRILFAASQ